MPPLPPFASVGDAYDAALALLTDSLDQTHAAGGTAGLRAVDAHSIRGAHRELVQTCAALINADWDAPPVSREGLIHWGRLATAARELLGAGPPADEPPPSADALIEQQRTRRVPWRIRGAKPLPVPKLGTQRTLHRLLSALPLPALDSICRRLLERSPPNKREAVAGIRASLATDVGRLRVLSLLSGDSYALLQRLLDAGGEVPLIRLSLAWGRLWQDPWGAPVAAMAQLQSLGLVVVGWDAANEQVSVVVPLELRTALASASWPAGSAAPPVVELQVELQGVTPPIWRRIQLRGDATVLDLHFALQSAFGWQNVRPHELRSVTEHSSALAGPAPGAVPEGLLEEEGAFVARVLGTEGNRLVYRYGHDGGWDHVVERVVPSSSSFVGRRRLVDGARAAPVDQPGRAEDGAGEAAVSSHQDQHGRHPESFDLKAAQRRFQR